MRRLDWLFPGACSFGRSNIILIEIMSAKLPIIKEPLPKSKKERQSTALAGWGFSGGTFALYPLLLANLTLNYILSAFTFTR